MAVAVLCSPLFEEGLVFCSFSRVWNDLLQGDEYVCSALQFLQMSVVWQPVSRSG